MEDIRQLHEYERHIEHSEQTDINLYKRSSIQNSSVEELVENNILQENIKKAIDELSDIQKNRIIKYFFENKTLDGIAIQEHTSHQAISKSISKGIQQIRKNLKF